MKETGKIHFEFLERISFEPSFGRHNFFVLGNFRRRTTNLKGQKRQRVNDGQLIVNFMVDLLLESFYSQILRLAKPQWM